MTRHFALLAIFVAAQPLLGQTPLASTSPRVEEEAIKNPYYSRPSWKLWFLDPTPVTFTASLEKSTKTTTFKPIAAERRLYPDLAALRNYPTDFVRVTSQNSQEVAGFWDDACATLDFGHSAPLADR
jgi:hypothetical protein